MALTHFQMWFLKIYNLSTIYKILVTNSSIKPPRYLANKSKFFIIKEHHCYIYTKGSDSRWFWKEASTYWQQDRLIYV